MVPEFTKKVKIFIKIPILSLSTRWIGDFTMNKMLAIAEKESQGRRRGDVGMKKRGSLQKRVGVSRVKATWPLACTSRESKSLEIIVELYTSFFKGKYIK